MLFEGALESFPRPRKFPPHPSPPKVMYSTLSVRGIRARDDDFDIPPLSKLVIHANPTFNNGLDDHLVVPFGATLLPFLEDITLDGRISTDWLLPSRISVQLKTIAIKNHKNFQLQWIASCRNLRTLKFYKVRVKGPETHLQSLSNLHTLIFDHCTFSGFVGRISNLPSLSILKFRKSSFPYHSPCIIGDFPKLTSFQIFNGRTGEIFFTSSNSPTQSIPATGRPLIRLNLSHNYLSELSNSIQIFSNIQILNLSHNDFEEIPSAIFSLHRIHTLDMHSNQLQGSLDTRLRRLTHLRSINLARNFVSSCSANFFESFPMIETVILDHNRLSRFDCMFSDCPKLQHLSLSHNHLQHVPDELYFLPNLKKLFLQHNRLKALPVNLKKIDHIDIRHNKLMFLPSSLFSSSSKQDLVDIYSILCGNPTIEKMDPTLTFKIPVVDVVSDPNFDNNILTTTQSEFTQNDPSIPNPTTSLQALSISWDLNSIAKDALRKNSRRLNLGNFNLVPRSTQKNHDFSIDGPTIWGLIQTLAGRPAQMVGFTGRNNSDGHDSSSSSDSSSSDSSSSSDPSSGGEIERFEEDNFQFSSSDDSDNPNEFEF